MQSEAIVMVHGGWCTAYECLRWPECELRRIWLDSPLINKFWCEDCEWCREHRPVPFTVTQSV
jgi:hypothetical protein